VLHLVIFVALISSAAGTLAGSGGKPSTPPDSGSAINVTFVNASNLAREDSETSSSNTLDIKVRNVQAQRALYETAARDKLSELMKRLQAAQPQAPTTAAKTAQRRTQTHLSTLSAQADAEGEQDLTTGASSSGALWGKIEPCWRKTPGSSAVRVTLEVAFNSQGGVAKPPRILRNKEDKLDEQRLNAEARAIAALRACAPQGSFQLANKLVRLDFRPAK